MKTWKSRASDYKQALLGRQPKFSLIFKPFKYFYFISLVFLFRFWFNLFSNFGVSGKFQEVQRILDILDFAEAKKFLRRGNYLPANICFIGFAAAKTFLRCSNKPPAQLLVILCHSEENIKNFAAAKIFLCRGKVCSL